MIYRVAVSVDRKVEKKWLTWMKRIHIPNVMQTGCFERYHLYRQLEPVEKGRATFIIAYTCRNQKMLNTYLKKFGPALRKEHEEKFAGKFSASRSILVNI